MFSCKNGAAKSPNFQCEQFGNFPEVICWEFRHENLRILMGMNEPNFPQCKKPALCGQNNSVILQQNNWKCCAWETQCLQVPKVTIFSEENRCKNTNHFPTRIFASVESGNSLPTCNPVECPFVLGWQRIVNQTTILEVSYELNVQALMSTGLQVLGRLFPFFTDAKILVGKWFEFLHRFSSLNVMSFSTCKHREFFAP